MEMSNERGCLHPRELPGRGIAAVPGHIPGSICSSKPRHWWGPPIVLVPVGRLALLSQHQPGCDGGQVLADSVAASSKAVGWYHWCSLGVGTSLGFAPSVILGYSGENVVTGNAAAKALKMAKALGA